MLAQTENVAGDHSPVTQYQGIAVLGSNPVTKQMAPFDGSWLVYGCSPDNSPFGFSEHRSELPKVDVWFEVHRPVFDRTRPYEYLQWLRKHPVVFMRDKIAMGMCDGEGKRLFPNAVPYPEKVFKNPKEFGPFHFTSSIAYMMAMAIKECEERRIPQIGLWGIMQQTKNEYTYQRPGVQHMIVEANRRGIKVVAPDVSGLFEPPPEDF